MLRYLVGLTCLGFGCIAVATGAQAFTAITTQWDETHASQQTCLDRAAAAIDEAGFKPLGHTTQSRHGIKGNYTVSIRCLTEMHVVFFVVAGPSRDVTPKYMDQVHGKYHF